MKNDKIIGNYNSERLFHFNCSQIKEGNKFGIMNIRVHPTEVEFNPSSLYFLFL